MCLPHVNSMISKLIIRIILTCLKLLGKEHGIRVGCFFDDIGITFGDLKESEWGSFVLSNI